MCVTYIQYQFGERSQANVRIECIVSRIALPPRSLAIKRDFSGTRDRISDICDSLTPSRRRGRGGRGERGGSGEQTREVRVARSDRIRKEKEEKEKEKRGRIRDGHLARIPSRHADDGELAEDADCGEHPEDAGDPRLLHR